ncbi:MAG: exodeoxyribonuclease VII large subunit [Candidatus Omnitrophica bacterium]|nr:exodeoxyribonuclease VII large subunit [Candidatus Omnitrophota bacterium]
MMKLEGPKVYTVREITRRIRDLMELNFPGIWIEGEISGFKHHSSGHMYFTLKDETAVLNAVFFARQNRGIKFELKDGLRVLVFGKISVYEPRGSYQLYVERIEPKGLGALQLAFLQLKEKLAQEGLFDTERKRPIPAFPRTIGVVTSPTGAAIRDILHIVNRRFRGTNVLLNPVKVQGAGAAEEIARALDEMNQMEDIDVLIVGRGGGSLEDLWAFNEEVVARAIHRSRIPVISAVGHEIDWTIADWVADLRAPTPSAAAELVVQNREELEIRLTDFNTRLRNAIRGLLEEKQESLRGLRESYAFRQPLALIHQYAQRLDELLRQLQNYLRNLVREKDQTFRSWVGRLGALNPLAILERGYSLTFNVRGELVKDIRQVRAGETLKSRLEKGIVYSKVEKTEKVEESKR